MEHYVDMSDERRQNCSASGVSIETGFVNDSIVVG